MNRSLQEYLRCIMNGNDTEYTEWLTDVKFFPLAYNSQVIKTLGLSPYRMVFNQKSRKSIKFTAKTSKTHKVFANPQKHQFIMIYHYIHTMKIIFITHNSEN